MNEQLTFSSCIRMGSAEDVLFKIFMDDLWNATMIGFMQT